MCAHTHTPTPTPGYEQNTAPRHENTFRETRDPVCPPAAQKWHILKLMDLKSWNKVPESGNTGLVLVDLSERVKKARKHMEVMVQTRSFCRSQMLLLLSMSLKCKY